MKFIIYLTLILFLFSCNNSPFPGYSVLNKNTYYQLHKFNDLEKSNVYKAKDVYKLKLLVSDLKSGKVLFDSHSFPDGCKILVNDASTLSNLLFNDLMKFDSGDSLSIVKITDSVTYLFNIKIISVYVHKEYESEKLVNEQNADFEETVNLNNYLKKNSLEAIEKEGVYFLDNFSEKIQLNKGEKVTLNYKGSYLNGFVFDSTSLNSPLEFIYGDEMQVLIGIERALKYVKIGEKTKIILPSQLAFGSKGSSDGRVPPYTTLVYELERIK